VMSLPGVNRVRPFRRRALRPKRGRTVDTPRRPVSRKVR
jgi:hypothetical protein